MARIFNVNFPLGFQYISSYDVITEEPNFSWVNVGSGNCMRALKEIAVSAGWTVRGSADGGGNYAWDGITSALDPSLRGSGGEYDCWSAPYVPALDGSFPDSGSVLTPTSPENQADGVPGANSWCVIENDGRQLLLRPSWTPAFSASYSMILYARKGSGGFDGSVADASGNIPGPPTSGAGNELALYSTRASPENEPTFMNTTGTTEDFVHFWANDSDENGAIVLGYVCQDGSSTTSMNNRSMVICPVIAGSQTDDDPDPVAIITDTGLQIGSAGRLQGWNPVISAFDDFAVSDNIEGLGYFFKQSGADKFEPVSGNESVFQLHCGHLATNNDASEWYKGPITENAVVVSSAPQVVGTILDLGWDDDQGVYMHEAAQRFSVQFPWPDTTTAPSIRSINVVDASWRGIRSGEQRDLTPPVIDNFSTPYSLAGQGDSITFDVTDIDPGLNGVYVSIEYANGLSECAYMRNSFTPHFTNGSSTTPIVNGLTFTLSRNHPWLGDFTVKVYAADSDGNDVGPVEQAYTIPGDVCFVPSIPSPDASMAVRTYTLLQLRDLAKDLSDMENSDFLSEAEWNLYINFGLQELYDLLAESHDQEFLLKTYSFQLSPPTNTYTLPADFHVMKGVDYSDCCFPSQTVDGDPGQQDTYDVQTQQLDRVYPLRPYTFEERHAYTHANALWTRTQKRPAMRYRIFSESIIDDVGGSPTTAYFHRLRLNPVTDGYIQVWYLPNVPYLTNDSDFTPSFYGFEEYPAIYAAIQALDKEESDSGPMRAKLELLKNRIRVMASARDVGYPGKISDVSDPNY